MAGRYGSVLTLKSPRVAALKVAQAQEEGPIERTHRPPVGAQRFGRSKTLAGGLIAALKALEDSYEDLPSDIDGNVW